MDDSVPLRATHNDDIRKQLAGLFSDAPTRTGDSSTGPAAQENPFAPEGGRPTPANIQALIDDLPVGYHELDLAGRITRVNRAELDMLGYTAEAMLGRPAWEFVQDQEVSRQAIQAKLAGEMPLDAVERDFVRQDGSLVAVLLQDQYIRVGPPSGGAADDQGQIVGIRTTLQDITHIKSMEARLAQERNLMRTLIDALPDYIYIKDTQSRFLLTNVAQAQLLGATSPDDMVGKRDADFFSEDLWRKYLADEQVILRSGQPLISIEEPTTDADGAAKWTLTTKVPVRNRQGEVTALVGMGRDITGRKNTEALLDKRIRELACLNDVSRKLDENPDLASFADWLADHIPPAMQYPELCVVGVELEGGQRRGHVEAFDLPTHIISGLRQVSGGEAAGRICIAYTDKRDFLNEESALIGNITRRVNAYLENRRLLDNIQRRAIQLQTAAEVSQAAASILDPDELLPKVVELVRERFNFYYVGVFMADQTNSLAQRASGLPFGPSRYAVLRAATGEAGRQMLAAGHKLEIGGSSMIGQCIAAGQARIALDVTLSTSGLSTSGSSTSGSSTSGVQVVRFDNPLLPKTRSEMALPLISRGRVLGAVTVQSDQPAAFTQEDMTVLQSMADQVVTAIQNATLFEQTQRRVEELATLNEIGREFSSAMKLQDVFPTVHRQVSRIFDAANFFIGTYREGSQKWTLAFQVEDGQPGGSEQRELGQGLTSYILRTRQPVLLSNIQENERFFQEHHLTRVGRVARSWMGIPLMAGGNLVGIMAIRNYARESLYTAQDLGLFSTIGAQAAIAIQNALLFEETQSRAEELSTLNEIGRELASALNSEELVEIVYRQVGRVFDVQDFYIATYEAGSDQWFVAFYVEFGLRQPTVWRKLGVGLTSHILINRESLLFHTSDEIDAFLNTHPFDRVGPQAKSWMGVPLVASNQVVGAMAIQDYTREHLYNDHDLALFSTIAAQVAIAIQNARLFNETQQRNTELGTLNEIISSASQTLELRALLDSVLRQTLQVFGFDGGLITMYNETRHKLERIVRTGLPGRIPDDPAQGLESSLCAYVFNTREAMAIEDFRQGAPIDVSGEIEAGYLSYIGIPVQARGRTLGTWCGFRKTAGPFGKNTLALLQTVSRQVGFAVENARLFQQTEQRVRQLATLNDIAREIASALGLQDLYRVVYEQVGRVFDATNFFIATCQEGDVGPAGERGSTARPSSPRSEPAQVNADYWTIEFQVEANQPGATGRRPAGPGLASHIIRTREPLILCNLAENTAFFQEQGIERVGTQAKSWMGVPLMVGGRLVGVMVIQSYEVEDLYGDPDILLFSTIASQAAVAIQNARLFEQARIRAEEMAVLNELSRSLTTHINLQGVIEEAYRGASRLLDTRYFYIGLYDPDKNEVSFSLQVIDGQIHRTTRVQSAEAGLAGYLIRTRQPLLLQNKHDGEEERQLGVASLPYTGQRISKCWLGAPMMMGDRVLGTMVILSYTDPYAFSEHQRDLFVAIGNQVAIALQNARSFEQARIQAEEMTVLNDLSRVFSTRLDVNQLLDEIHRGASRLMDTTNFFIALYDPQIDQVSFPFYAEGDNIRPLASRRRGGHGMTEHVIRTRAPLLMPDNVQARLDELGIESIGTQAQSWLGVPMLVGEQVVGVVAVQSYTTPRVYDEHHRDLLSAIAAQAAIAIQNARLLDEARSRAKELAALNELSRALASRLNLHQVLDEVYRGVSRLVNTTNFYIGLYDEARHEVSFVLNISESVVDQEITVLPAEQGITGYIIRTRASVLIKAGVGEWLEKMGMPHVGEPAASWLAVPLMLGEQVLGVLAVQDYKLPNAYDEHDRDMLLAIGSQAAIALQNARLFEQAQSALAETRAMYDASRALAAADTWQDMTAAVVAGLRVSAINRAVLMLFEHNAQGEIEAAVVQANWTNGQGTQPAPVGTRYPKAVLSSIQLLLSPTPVFFDNVQLDERIDAAQQALLELQNIRSLAVLPILTGNRPAGVLVAEAEVNHHFTEREIQSAPTLVGQMAVVMENQRLFQETQAHARREQILREITARVRSSNDPDVIVRTAVRELGTALGRPAFVRLLPDERRPAHTREGGK